MAKNTVTQLSRNDIILGAEAEIIRQALEARIEIDRLLEERARAYELIASLEEQVGEIIGDDQDFPFPEPDLPIYGLTRKPGSKKPAPRPKPAPKPAKVETQAAPSAAPTGDTSPTSGADASPARKDETD